MIKENLSPTTLNNIEYKSSDVVLEQIPEIVYRKMVTLFSEKYHFENGNKMRLSNYFVKISRSFSDTFVDFIHDVTEGLLEKEFPEISTPEGFKPHFQNLLEVESKGGFSLGSFDMAVTQNGLQNIEFQSVATYPISAAKLNQYLLDTLSLNNAFIFADSPQTNWNDFISIYEKIIAGNKKKGIILIDRKIKEQKTNFEFFATQKELNVSIDIVDMERLFEKEGALFYLPSPDQPPIKITRVYNRILLAEALFEDDYPNNSQSWNFRFDKNYKSLKFINHPIKQFKVSKRLSPYIHHPYNPDCFELLTTAQDFKNGILKYKDFVWKHKWGAAGHRLILEPNAKILEELSECLEDYIAQKKVEFKIFKTNDGQEKIVELRFMTAIHDEKIIIVPMARIGHVIKNQEGDPTFKIHFGDNNKEGYGFSPVIILDDKN